MHKPMEHYDYAVLRVEADMTVVTYREAAAVATMICAMPIAFTTPSTPMPTPLFTHVIQRRSDAIYIYIYTYVIQYMYYVCNTNGLYVCLVIIIITPITAHDIAPPVERTKVD